MKKRIMIMLTMAIVFAMIAIPSVAATITAGAGSDSHEVKATYKPNSGSGGSGGIVYSVDITWDAMEFTYTEGEAGAWLPEEHQYAPNEKAIWSSTSNTVKITNHSNTAITATLSYTAAAGYTSITGAFYETSGNANDGVLALSTAVGTTFANAPTASASLMLSGIRYNKLRKLKKDKNRHGLQTFGRMKLPHTILRGVCKPCPRKLYS